MTDFQWLEKLLRDGGFIIGRLTVEDEQTLDAMLKEIRERFRNA